MTYGERNKLPIVATLKAACASRADAAEAAVKAGSAAVDAFIAAHEQRQQQLQSASSTTAPLSYSARAVSSLEAGRSVFTEVGYTVLRGFIASKAEHSPTVVAVLALAVQEQQRAANRLGEAIAGNQTQQAFKAIATAAAKQVESRMRSLFIEVLAFLGMESATLQLHLVDCKLLVSIAGNTKAVHWDDGHGWDAPRTQITLLLHCTEGEGIHTTSVPNFDTSALFQNLHHLLPNIGERTKYERIDNTPLRPLWAKLIPLLQPQDFHSVAARIGDITVIRQHVPHYGTQHRGAASPSSPPRLVCFAMTSAVAGDGQDGALVSKLKADAAFMEEYYGEDNGPLWITAGPVPFASSRKLERAKADAAAAAAATPAKQAPRSNKRERRAGAGGAKRARIGIGERVVKEERRERERGEREHDGDQGGRRDLNSSSSSNHSHSHRIRISIHLASHRRRRFASPLLLAVCIVFISLTFDCEGWTGVLECALIKSTRNV